MKFSALLSAGLMACSAMADNKKTTTSSVATPTPVATSNVFPWERLDKNNSVRLPPLPRRNVD